LKVKIIETPRDGFQGLKQFIPTESKIRFINQLLKAGFDTVEVGSFVSPSAIPQMKDTEEVIHGLDYEKCRSHIMVLVANTQGGLKAAEFEQVDYLLYPYSVSPTFLKKNINAGLEKARGTIQDLLEISSAKDKQLIVYLTMGFGNPYGDRWNPKVVLEEAGYLYNLGLRIIPLSDILGDVSPETIREVYTPLISAFPDVEFGIHLHARPGEWFPKVEAAWECGIRRFDTVLGGVGGCPMAGDELVSNLDTRDLLTYLNSRKEPTGIDLDQIDGIIPFSY
jgi:hydroxymethylglutaryl-CoA lyase